MMKEISKINKQKKKISILVLTRNFELEDKKLQKFTNLFFLISREKMSIYLQENAVSWKSREIYPLVASWDNV